MFQNSNPVTPLNIHAKNIKYKISQKKIFILQNWVKGKVERGRVECYDVS